jgi:hypothetical protein
MNKKKVAILQSNYIPWKGYFDLINMVDEFIFYDEMQYTKNDWRNRNKIKGPNGLHWLTIPVRQLSLSQKINETEIADTNWNKKHFSTIKQYYSNAPFFKEYKSFFEDLYISCNYKYLSEINFSFISSISKLINIDTKLSWSSDYGLVEGKTERLIDLVKKANGTEYISGPSAKDYIDESLFREAGIELTWMNYSDYPEYTQIHPPYAHGVSIVDLIFNVGNNYAKFMKTF